jgi:hypothetical protein
LRQCRLLYVKRPPDGATSLPARTYCQERLIKFDPNFVTTLLRRTALGVIGYRTGMVPTEAQFDEYGKLPAVPITSRQLFI